MANVYFKGETIFLYVKFYDIHNQPAKSVNDPCVRILHVFENNIYEDLPWTDMVAISNNEYYYNYVIPYDSDCGQYNVFYNGEIDGDNASIIENFHVISRSEEYENAIKVFGYVDDIINHTPLANVDVNIINTIEGYHSQSSSKDNGYWETFIYPGEYTCLFKKDGFKESTISFQLGNENTEMQFNNVSLEPIVAKANGTGVCEITDTILLKNGIPLDGITIQASLITDVATIIATDVTDNKGQWTLNLDPGYYFLKMKGTSMDQEFDKTFRLKINNDLKYTIEDIDTNRAIAQKDNLLTTGNGSIEYSDSITDRNGNPIVDVHIIIYTGTTPIAQTYTDPLGKWTVHLDPGTYIVEIYHPSFKDIPNFNITV